MLWTSLGLGGIESRGTAALQYPRATVPARVLFTGERGREAAARAGGALGTPAAGLRPRPAREKGFPSNLLLDFRLIHLLSLYREV
jgi:hypothetical protein